VADTTTGVDHPATFTPAVLDVIRDVLLAERELQGRELEVLDPFAGTGGIHALDVLDGINTYGLELEPEWAGQHPDTMVGDATDIPDPDNTFDAVATSPAYGNRMADAYDGRDGSTRRTYRLALGRPLTEGSGAGLQFHNSRRGDGYRDLHAKAIAEMVRVVKPGGLIVVNMKNHIRGGYLQLAVEWWLQKLLEHGCAIVEIRRVPVTGYGFGQNGDLRVDAEHVIVVRTGAAGS